MNIYYMTRGLELKIVNGTEVAEHLTLKLTGILNYLGDSKSNVTSLEEENRNLRSRDGIVRDP